MNKTALITGVGRANSIGYVAAKKLAENGWNVCVNYLHSYDDRAELTRDENDLDELVHFGQQRGVTIQPVELDLQEAEAPASLIEHAAQLGEVRAVITSHAESIDSDILTTSIESFDRHFAVNTRANWLLLKAYAEYAHASLFEETTKSFVALTSDHVAYNLPYGMSKGALDRLIAAGAVELGGQGFRVNGINPGPINTGWMNEELEQVLTQSTPAGRLGTPEDTAHLIEFLLSDAGHWINGQILHSNGGFGVS
ncbi:SDR family oxidoreductase [Rothia terrae]|uniref:SDR family oxidoreductase n=1 Tax=Rothia terrae TaxID=396015 RepID=A0A7H2BDH8_9MICC|nr:SDR family oxidoreductase [Rothia terrae]QNV37724.1 SDR family oxidoreductase [Rothia terrae]